MDKITADSTVCSQESNLSDDASKNSIGTGDSKTESCRNSKHSKDILIHPASHRQQMPIKYLKDDNKNNNNNDDDKKKKINNLPVKKLSSKKKRRKDDTNIMMITSCGQLIFGLVLITFGILVLIHGMSLGLSGAGLWAGMGALVAGSLGLVATLAESTSFQINKKTSSSGFSTAHLATSLVALGLANLSTIAAINSIVRDARSSENDLFISTNGDGKIIDDEEVESSWEGLLATCGLLVSSILELFVAGYTCIRLSPKLCSCLSNKKLDKEPESELDIVRTGGIEFDADIGKLKTRNMVHQWVIAQTHSSKNHSPVQSSPSSRPPFYIVHQPVMALQPVLQTPYGAVHYPKHPGGYHLPAYGPIPMIPQVIPPLGRVSSMQMYRTPRQKRHQVDHHQRDDSIERKTPRDTKNEPKRMTSIGEDENLRDLSLTYTGLDKKISEEFISIAMDPERKSKASSHYGSEIDALNAKKQ